MSGVGVVGKLFCDGSKSLGVIVVCSIWLRIVFRTAEEALSETDGSWGDAEDPGLLLMMD